MDNQREKFDLEEWNKIMGDNSDESTQNMDEFSEKVEDIDEIIREKTKKILTAAKNSDTVKILKEVAEDIMPKINEMKVWIGYLEQIKKEIEERNLENPNIEMMEDEIKKLEGWKGFEKDVKQLVGQIAIEVGKKGIEGVGKLGKNFIGSSIIGSMRIIKSIKNFATGSIYKMTDEKSISKIEDRRNNNKKYEIEDIEGEEYEDVYEEKYDSPINWYEKYEEDEEYEEYEEPKTKNIKENNLVKRIKGVKTLGNEISKKYKSSKEKLERFIIKARKKVDNTKAKATQIKTSAVKKANEVKKDVVEIANNTKNKVVTKANDAKDKYEQAKNRFEKRKNDTLINVLNVGEKFSKNLLGKIETTITTKQEKLQQKNEKLQKTYKETDMETKIENQHNTMEM